MSNWYDYDKFRFWNNRIVEIKTIYEGDLEEDITKLEENYNKWDKVDIKFYFDKIFPTVFKLFSAKVKLELGKIDSEFLTFDTFENRYNYGIYLIGTSIEPIILSLTAIKPKKVVFIYTSQTTDQDLNDIKRHLKEKCSIILKHADTVYKEINTYRKDEISESIKALLNDLFKEGIGRDKIAIDITGGKKSMGNIAYALASLEGLDTFYIDFENYVRDKPVPGTEFIRLQDNPIESFIERLRDVHNKFNKEGFIPIKEIDNILGKSLAKKFIDSDSSYVEKDGNIYKSPSKEDLFLR